MQQQEGKDQRTKQGAGAKVEKWAGSAKERTNAKCKAEGRAQAPPALPDGYERPGTTYSRHRMPKYA
eukprot:6196413-Pleurochrysis_carterae.AAC.3